MTMSKPTLATMKISYPEKWKKSQKWYQPQLQLKMENFVSLNNAIFVKTFGMIHHLRNNLINMPSDSEISQTMFSRTLFGL
jgi:hypothetical protein